MNKFVRTIGLTLTTAVLASSFAFAAAPDMDNATAPKKPAHKTMAKGHHMARKTRHHRAAAHRTRRHHKAAAHRTSHHKSAKHTMKKAAPKSDQ